MREMEGLNIRKPAKTAKNYMREMEGLISNNHFAGLVNEVDTVQGRNSRKRVNRRKTRRLRR